MLTSGQLTEKAKNPHSEKTTSRDLADLHYYVSRLVRKFPIIFPLTISKQDAVARISVLTGPSVLLVNAEFLWQYAMTAMDRRQFIQSVLATYAASLSPNALAPLLTRPESSLSTVRSKDGTLIAVECAGAGPSLVIVHGGTGDRTRWTPLFPLFASRFTICAMDRRGHGASGDSPNFSLQREVEDVVAVVNSRPGLVFVLGHSYGAVCALEAAFLTHKISKLVLYEPPLQDHDNAAVLARMEKMIQEGDRDEALVTFLQEIVMISPSEVAAMKTRPSWSGLLASVDSSIRQDRELATYRFDPKRISALHVPTLLLTGSETASPQLKLAISGLLNSLPNRSLFVFEGQEHNAMDTVPQQFAEVVGNFLLNTPSRTSAKHQ